MSARHFFCSAVNIRGTQRAETIFIHKCSVIIRCAVLELMPVVSSMCVMVKRLSLFRSSCTAWMLSAVVASFGRPDRGSSAGQCLYYHRTTFEFGNPRYMKANFRLMYSAYQDEYPCQTFLSKKQIFYNSAFFFQFYPFS